MKKIHLALGLSIGLLLSSCSLDTNPSSDLPEDEIISTVADLQNAVNGIGYIFTQSEARLTYASEYGLYADLLTNEFKIADDYGQSSPIARYSLTSNDEMVSSGYRYFYQALANCNKDLELSKNLEETAAVKDLWGQLYAWRALIHFDIARLYAHIPAAGVVDANAANTGIVLSTAVYDSEYRGSRSTLAETYRQIIADFTKAMELMPRDAAKKTGYMNYYAAEALRARAYLYNGQYEEALADARDVIANGGYKLYTRENYAKAWAEEGTTESIFELLITSTHNLQRYSVGYYCDAAGYPECAMNEKGDIMKYLLANAGDIRNSVIKQQTITGDTEQNYYPAKYPGRDGLYVNNPKIIRLSEVYLIAAEAALLQPSSDASAAAAYINEIEKNRVENYTEVQTITIDDILMEYKKELFAENQIAFAYWRNKKSITSQLDRTVNYDDYRTILPIPQREIDFCGVDILKQNPGY